MCVYIYIYIYIYIYNQEKEGIMHSIIEAQILGMRMSGDYPEGSQSELLDVFRGLGFRGVGVSQDIWVVVYIN